MAKNKLKNEFVVSVSPGSEWHYVLNSRSLHKLEKISGKQNTMQMPGILGFAKALSAPDHFNLACQTIDSSPTMKHELATVIADLILKAPKQIRSIVEFTETQEQHNREQFLNCTYKLDTEELLGYDSWNFDNEDQLWTLETLRQVPIEKYDGGLTRVPEDQIQDYIARLTHDTNAARAALSIVLNTDTLEKKRASLINTLSTINGYRSLLDIAGIYGIHFGDRTYEQGDFFDGAFEEEIITTFDAVAAVMRNIDEISKPQTDQDKPPYNAISVRESKEGGIKIIRKSVIDLYRENHPGAGLPSLDSPD